jgi:hypothetical protein
MRLCAAAAVFAISAAAAAGLSRDQVRTAEDRIEAAYRSERAACESLNGNARDICIAQAKGDEKVARAKLEYLNSGKATDMMKLATARADAAYGIATERCDDVGGNARDVCLRQASAQHVAALADAKAAKKTSAARVEAGDEKTHARHKVEPENCGTLTGNARSQCVATVKVR